MSVCLSMIYDRPLYTHRIFIPPRKIISQVQRLFDVVLVLPVSKSLLHTFRQTTLQGCLGILQAGCRQSRAQLHCDAWARETSSSHSLDTETLDQKQDGIMRGSRTSYHEKVTSFASVFFITYLFSPPNKESPNPTKETQP